MGGGGVVGAAGDQSGGDRGGLGGFCDAERSALHTARSAGSAGDIYSVWIATDRARGGRVGAGCSWKRSGGAIAQSPTLAAIEYAAEL